MKTTASQPAADLAAMEQAVNATSWRLHGIASRTVGAHIASEVLRLNDAVRAGAAGRISHSAQPADFPALLLASADPVNAQEAT